MIQSRIETKGVKRRGGRKPEVLGLGLAGKDMFVDLYADCKGKFDMKQLRLASSLYDPSQHRIYGADRKSQHSANC